MTATTADALPSQDLPLTLTVEEVMAHLRIGRSMVYKLMRNGSLTYAQVGAARRIHTASLLAYIAPDNGSRRPA